MKAGPPNGVPSASTLTALAVGGVAWAVQSPVDSNGAVQACYNPTTGALHLNVVGHCPTTGQKTPLSWDQSGVRELQYDDVNGGHVPCLDSTLANCAPSSALPPWAGRELNSAWFPPNAKVTLDYGANLGVGSQACFDVIDLTTWTPIPGTKVCAAGPLSGDTGTVVALSTPSFSLNVGDHRYGVETGEDGSANQSVPLTIHVRW